MIDQKCKLQNTIALCKWEGRSKQTNLRCRTVFYLWDLIVFLRYRSGIALQYVERLKNSIENVVVLF